MRVVRVVRIAVVVAMAAGLGTSCAKKKDDRVKALAAIKATEALPRKFTMSESTAGLRLDVDGTISDDLRYAGRLAVGGTDLLQEVYSDDALALRVVDGDRLGAALASSTSASVTGDQTADQALQRHQWVVDPAGAPPIVVSSRQGPVAGMDPIDEGFRYLQFAEKAINEAFAVEKYSPDSLDYKPSEDPFPRPKIGGSVTRYDLLRPFVPTVADLATPGSRNVPANRNYRKMSIYVEHGHVTKILEDTEFAERLKDTTDFVRGVLNQSKQPQSVKDDFERTVHSSDRAAYEQGLLQALNISNKLMGEPPITFRKVSYELRDVGQPATVELPAGAVRGKLAAFFPKATDTGSGTAPAPLAPLPAVTPPTGGGAPGESTTTTTTASPAG